MCDEWRPSKSVSTQEPTFGFLGTGSAQIHKFSEFVSCKFFRSLICRCCVLGINGMSADGHSRATKQVRGFTLLELVTVLLLLGILAVFVTPRFFDRNFYESRGFYDEVLSVLRYAQKAAIAQRRNVCVQFSATTVTLTIASATGAAAPCNTELAGPTAVRPYSVTAPSGTQFANTSNSPATPTDFTFNALGQASIGQTFRISGFGQDINVVQETGYVHP